MIHPKNHMKASLTYRKATIQDLGKVIDLLREDELGKAREGLSEKLNQCYIDAFYTIHNDPNQYLMVALLNLEIVGTAHLTIIPSLTFRGSTRMQIEGIRILEKHRGQGFGRWMLNAAIDYGKQHNASIIQLTTNKKRLKSTEFYEKLGFQSTHHGMKLYLPPS